MVATSSGEAELYAAVSVMKDMILIKRALSFIGLTAKMELRIDSSAACALLERQGAGRMRLCCGRSSGSRTEVWPCVVNQRAPTVRTWVPRSILWH